MRGYTFKIGGVWGVSMSARHHIDYNIKPRQLGRGSYTSQSPCVNCEARWRPYLWCLFYYIFAVTALTIPRTNSDIDTIVKTAANSSVRVCLISAPPSSEATEPVLAAWLTVCILRRLVRRCLRPSGSRVTWPRLLGR